MAIYNEYSDVPVGSVSIKIEVWLFIMNIHMFGVGSASIRLEVYSDFLVNTGRMVFH